MAKLNGEPASVIEHFLKAIEYKLEALTIDVENTKVRDDAISLHVYSYNSYCYYILGIHIIDITKLNYKKRNNHTGL